MTLSVNPTRVTVTVPVTISPTNLRAYVGLYRPIARDTDWLDWAYIGSGNKTKPTVAKTSANISFTIEQPVGIYEFRSVSLPVDSLTFKVVDKSLPFCFDTIDISAAKDDRDKLDSILERGLDIGQSLFDSINKQRWKDGKQSISMQTTIEERVPLQKPQP